MATSKRGSWGLGQAVGVRATLRTTLPLGLSPPPGASQSLGKRRHTQATFALPPRAGLTADGGNSDAVVANRSLHSVVASGPID